MSLAVDIFKSLLFPNREQHAIPPLDGALLPNNRLETMPALDLRLREPDDVAEGPNGTLYVSSDRQLLQLSGDNLHSASVVAEFEAPISAFTRLSDGSFVVGVNGAGLRHVDGSGATLSLINRLDGAPLGCITAIAEDPKRGGVYFTVGSTRHDARDWVWDLMEGNRTGLLAYWLPETASGEILLDRLAYPNGVEVEVGTDSLLLTQSWAHNLCRFRLSGGRGGSLQVVIDNMPGYPARITPAVDGGHWLSLFGMRTQLIELVLKESLFRREMMERVEPELWIRPALRSTGSYLEPLQGGGIKKLGIRKPWAPPRSYGLVVRLDAECEPADSLHSRVDGANHGVMAAREIGSQLVVAVKGNDCLLVENMTALEVGHG